MRPILFSLLTLACGSVSATFYGGGDALYWQLGSRSFDYALVGSSVNSICPDYNGGGRLYGGYQCDCLRFELSGLWVNGSNTGEVRGEELTLPFNLGNAESAKGRLQTSYWNVDGRAGFAFHRDCLLSLELLAGGRFVSLTQRREVQSDELFGKEWLAFCGGGPEVGVRAESVILCGFYVAGELDLIALIGERKQKLSRSEELDLSFRDETVVVPAVDLRLALGYRHQVRCWELAGELGYQLNYLYQPLTPLVEFAQSTGAIPAARWERDVSFGGPFIGIRVGF